MQQVAGDGDDLAAWDAVAEAYSAAPDVDWFDDFLARHLGDVTGTRILDLGCGDGRFAAQLHTQGADVVAIDGSAALLDIARTRHPGPHYEQRDLNAAGITTDDGAFDAVVSLMVLMDLRDLSNVRPRLAPGGVLVATLLHPAFYLQKTVDEDDGNGYRQVRGYLEHEDWWIEAFGGHWHHHRPLSAYIDWISSLGLGVVELFEPPAYVYEGWRRHIPTRLGLAARAIAQET
jgi:SAM-dependent methyltransferase